MADSEEERLVFEVDAPGRLDRFLADKIEGSSRSRLAAMIKSGEVTVNGESGKAGLMLRRGWKVELPRPVDRPPHDLSKADLPIEVLFQDEHLLVVSKPRGVPTHPAPTYKGPTLVNGLLALGGPLSDGSAEYRPGIVHRLDKDTTGLLLVAKTESAHRALAGMIKLREVQRSYVLIAADGDYRDRFDVEAPIGRDPKFRLRMAVHPDGKPALTHFRVIRRESPHVLLEARLETGRTHQIRVHAAAILMPVVGDTLYGTGSSHPLQMDACPLQLHAWRLCLAHPVTGERLDVRQNPPDDFLMGFDANHPGFSLD